MATVYLLHYERPIGNPAKPTGCAQHYMGSTRKNLNQRLEEHRSGEGAKITAAFARADINFVVARTWEGGWMLERALKRWHKHSRLCPVCNPKAHRNGNLDKPINP